MPVGSAALPWSVDARLILAACWPLLDSANQLSVGGRLAARPSRSGASGSRSAVRQLATAIGSGVVTTIYFAEGVAHGASHAMTTSLVVVGAITLGCLASCGSFPRRRPGGRGRSGCVVSIFNQLGWPTRCVGSPWPIARMSAPDPDPYPRTSLKQALRGDRHVAIAGRYDTLRRK
jgi:hypothetical protein